MHTAFVKINGVPTRITCWGKWIEESFTNEDSKDVVLMLTGNPGITTYYHKFLETIHLRTGFNVWILSHAGHEAPEEPTTMIMPSLKGNGDLYNLQGQTDHKIQFIKKYVPKDCRLHIMGHSIGAYMCCQILKDLELNSLIDKAYLLFPTIEDMANTPNGKFYVNVVQRIHMFLIFFTYFFAYFPKFIRVALVQFFLFLMGIDRTFLGPTLTLLQPNIARNSFYLADDEIATVILRDDAVVTHKDKIVAYCGQADAWVPVNFCEKLQRDADGIRAIVAKKPFKHAFVFKHSKEMGEIVADWLNEK